MIPATLSFEEKAIPSALKAREQWVCWRAVPNGDRIEKIPVCADTGSHASSTDPDTWTDFTTAVMKAFTTEDLGIGFVFTQDSGITGIDLDKCRDPESGVLEPWAEEILQDLNSYTEISPSGRGLHIYVLGELPPGRMKKGRIEAYQRGRFFTVTGRHLEGTPATVEERTGQLLAFHARCLAEPIQQQRQPSNRLPVPV
jgi:putative DNA primase/helicase